MSAVSPSPAADALAAISRVGMIWAASKPADARKNNASASSSGAWAVSPESERTCSFHASMSAAEALEMALIFVNALSKSKASLPATAPTRPSPTTAFAIPEVNA